MANQSDILNSKYPSPTTFVGAVSSGVSITYTAPSPMLLTVVVSGVSSGTGSVSVSGILFYTTSFTFCEVNVALSQGQVATISAVNAAQALVSARRIS